MAVYLFEQNIGGRAYRIEVTAVANRWRAQLQRLAGMPTALMPFYGSTPQEAAEQLTRWLSLAHARQGGQSPAAPGAGSVAGASALRYD